MSHRKFAHIRCTQTSRFGECGKYTIVFAHTTRFGLDYSSVGHMTYNQLVTYLAEDPDEKYPESVVARQAAQKFLNESQGQLTVHGLTELHSSIKEGELVVFFRNNHFSTLLKRSGYLFQLVTDAGLLRAMPQIVWQRIGYIDGDDTFLDCNFREPVANDSSPALAGGRSPDSHSDASLALASLALARQLQYQEYGAAQAVPEQRRPTGPPPSRSHHRRESRSDSCMLL